jgi:hypothetical protein
VDVDKAEAAPKAREKKDPPKQADLDGQLHMAFSQGDESRKIEQLVRDKYEDAEVINQRALEGREEVLGNEHPDTLWSLHNLAIDLRRQRKDEEAEMIDRRALEGREKALGQS